MSEEQKVCARCTLPKPIGDYYTIKGRKRKRAHSYCKECTKIVNSQRSPEDPEQARKRMHRWREERWAENLFNGIKTSARNRGLVLEINPEVIRQLWISQNGSCALSNVAMTKSVGLGRVYTNVSVDRIDSAKGYTIGNVWLVCAIVNRMKQELTVASFQDWCFQVVRARKVSTSE